jgi:protein-disulfide isomerase
MEKPKFDEVLRQNQATAGALGIEGTPGFLVDAKINVGFAPAEQLAQLAAEVRKSGCVVC